MWIPYDIHIQREQKQQDIVSYKRLNIFDWKRIFKLGKRIWNKTQSINLFVILSRKFFFYGGIPLMCKILFWQSFIWLLGCRTLYFPGCPTIRWTGQAFADLDRFLGRHAVPSDCRSAIKFLFIFSFVLYMLLLSFIIIINKRFSISCIQINIGYSRSGNNDKVFVRRGLK